MEQPIVKVTESSGVRVESRWLGTAADLAVVEDCRQQLRRAQVAAHQHGDIRALEAIQRQQDELAQLECRSWVIERLVVFTPPVPA